MAILNDHLWSEKYRPKVIADTILPTHIKQTFQGFVDGKNISNLILAGNPGMGKTTSAIAMLNEIDADWIKINGSLNGGIDNLRTEILQFASSISFSGGKKYVIIDEAERLSAATQDGLKSFIEEYSKNAGFIFTCNNKSKLIEPLHSRCAVVNFTIPNAEGPSIAKAMMVRILNILDLENVEYDKASVAYVIKRYFPDFRKTLNELQKYSVSTGKIDEGILSNSSNLDLKVLIDLMKDKNFTEMRKWVGQNNDMDFSSVYRKIYDSASSFLKNSSIPEVILIIGKYQYQSALVADQEINLVCCLTEIMMCAEYV